MRRKPKNDPEKLNQRSAAPAYTLVELLIVVTLIGIVVGIAFARFEPGYHDQVQAAAQIVAGDLAYARSLAVSNNSQYRITFDPTRHQYWIEHSGTNVALNALPFSPYRDASDPVTKQTTNLAKLSAIGGNVELAAVRKVSSSNQTNATTVEFGPLGSLTQPEDCWIWLAIGRGTSRRYVPVALDAITGLAELGEFQTAGPPTIGTASASK